MKEFIPALASQSSHFVGECYDLIAPLISKDDPEPDKHIQAVCAQLYLDCHLTSESALMLVQVDKEWDAEILMRAVMEGTVKYVYIFHGGRARISSKVVEYLDILPDFSSIRRHDKASLFLSEVSDPESMAWQPFRDTLLTEQQIERKRHGMNRGLRKKLEQEWSVTEILKSFSNDDQHKKMHSHLLYGYGMASHLIHKDADGVSMVWERRQRPAARQNSITIGHSCRVMSDICNYSHLRTEQLLKFKNKEIAPLWQLREKYSELFSLLEKSNEQFINTEYAEEN